MNPKTEENKQETETAEEKDYEMLDDISRDKVKIKQFYQDQSLGMQELPAVMEIGDFAFARSSLQGILDVYKRQLYRSVSLQSVTMRLRAVRCSPLRLKTVSTASVTMLSRIVTS